MEQYLLKSKLQVAIDGEKVVAAVFFTFNFEPAFFENYVLPIVVPSNYQFTESSIANQVLWKECAKNGDLPLVTVYCDNFAKDNIEAADMFKAFADEKSIPLHGKHHEHVELAAGEHKKEAETIAVSTQAADTSGSPAEKRVIKHLAALVPGSFVNDAEREELRRGIETIRLGKYAPLVRKLDKHFKDKTAKNGVILLGETLGILREYTKPTNGEAENGSLVSQQIKPAEKPEIILSESFDS